MGKGRDYRGPRRRGFDDDVFPPPDMREPRQNRPPAFGGGQMRSGPVPQGPTVAATVKWFNSEKGFGFVELADGSGDAFLHVAVLQAAGHDSVQPGTKLQVQVGQGQKGRQITSVLELDASTAAAAPPARSGGFARGPSAGGGERFRPDPASAVELTGTVKWFNADKGFGFIAAEDGGKDVFVHASVLAKAGLRTLAEGQRVAMRVVQGQKGREAISITAD